MLDFLFDFLQFLLQVPILLFDALINIFVAFADLCGFPQFSIDHLLYFRDVMNDWSWLVPVNGMLAAVFCYLFTAGVIRAVRWLLGCIPWLNL